MRVLADKDILRILSAVFTDLGAGWFAFILIGQTYGNIHSQSELLLFLTVNIIDGTLSLVLAVILAKMAKKL